MIYDRLRRLIVDGEVPAGVKLSETDLARSLAVSRTPVREALSRLEGDGLVRARGRGVHVAVLDDTALGHVFEARAEFEAWTASRVAEQVDQGLVPPSRLAELTTLAAETDRLTRVDDLEAAVRSNREFHLAIARAAGNPVIHEALERWWDQILLATRHGLRRPDRAAAVAREHEEILAAIGAGHSAAAGAAARRHVLTTSDDLDGGNA